MPPLQLGKKYKYFFQVKNEKNSEVLPKRHASIVVANNVMQEEQSVQCSSTHTANVRKRAISHQCATRRKKVQQLQEDEKALMKVACKWKLSSWYRLADVSFFKSAEVDFTTTLACQLDTGATCNVLFLDDLSIITQLGDPPMDNSSVKVHLTPNTTSAKMQTLSCSKSNLTFFRDI